MGWRGSNTNKKYKVHQKYREYEREHSEEHEKKDRDIR